MRSEAWFRTGSRERIAVLIFADILTAEEGKTFSPAVYHLVADDSDRLITGAYSTGLNRIWTQCNVALRGMDSESVYNYAASTHYNRLKLRDDVKATSDPFVMAPAAATASR